VTARPPITERRGLEGHLRLVCDVDEKGRSYLREQSFSAPFHLSKSFQDNGVLVVNLVNPTAGLFRGDVARSEVEVKSAARVLLTSPSATRVHNTQEGRTESVQKFSVSANGWLEILPELFIPQQGARHRQSTRIDVEPAGDLIFLEMLAPGRVASGEVFAFAELDWRTEIRSAGRLVVREKFLLSPGNKSLRALSRFSAHPYVATFFLITEKLPATSECWSEIDSLHSPDLWIGSSQLVAAGRVIKLLARDSNRLRQAVAVIREKIHRAAGWPLPQARKL
jgi:urease accessory protein